MQVLLVEDDPGITFGLKLLLELEGFQPQTAVSGDDALILAEQHLFEVVLLDLHTNGIPPEEFLPKLRDLCHFRRIPVPKIGIISGSVKIDAEAKRLGADFVIRKPFEHDLLLCSIRSQVQPLSA